MYIRTSERCGSSSISYGYLAGPFGEPPLPQEIKKFLERVKKRPEDYDAVLLIIHFHVEPFASDQLRKAFMASFENDARDPLEEAKAIQERVTQELEGIYNQHLRDTRFSRLVKTEKQLIAGVAKVFQKTIQSLETKGWLEPLLIDALLADSPLSLVAEVGRPFVLSNLPGEIAEQILNSRVPETHYARLGKGLLLMAEQRQNDNPAFKERVEQERKKRGQ